MSTQTPYDDAMKLQGLTQPDKDSESYKISRYYERFMKAEMGVGNRHKIWAELDMFDRGEQWKNAAIPPWVPKPVTNYMRYARTLKRANLASSIPTAHFTARNVQSVDPIQKLQRAYEYVWESEKVPRTIRRCIDRSIIQGTAIVQVYDDDRYVGGTYYGKDNPDNKLFQGRICVKRIPNANFFPDPDAYCAYDAKYIETTEILPLSTVKNTEAYQKHAGEQLANLRYSQLVDMEDDADGTIYDRDTKPNEGAPSTFGDELVTVHAHWERYLGDDNRWHLDCSYYVKNIPFFLLVLKDIQPNVYPFAVLYDEEEENTFWGNSTLMDIWENQKVINKTSQTASIIGTLHQNPQKIVSRESGINAQEMARTGTMPGKVWTANGDPTRAMHVAQPADIPKGLFELEDRMAANIKEMVGINEAYTGQSVGSLTTSTGVNALIERATVRDKDKMIQIDAFVEEISNLIVLHIIHKWKDKRDIVVKGRDGRPVHETYIPIDSLTAENLDWIVKSDIYAVAPTTQALRKQQADNLMQLQGQFQFNPPVITPEEWLKMQDFSDKDMILQRMVADRQKMQAEQAQNMAQIMTQAAQQIQQALAQGMSPENAAKMAQQFAQEILQQREQQAAQGKGASPTAPRQAPQAGAMAMQAMARGN